MSYAMISSEEGDNLVAAPVLEKPTISQLLDVIDTLMNYSMTIDTAELKSLTVKVSRLVENEVTAHSRQGGLKRGLNLLALSKPN